MAEVGDALTVSKAMSAAAGLIGGLTLSVFWQPEKIRQHGALAAGAIVGGISVGGAFTLTGMVASNLGLDISNVDTAMGVGFCLGILIIALVNFLANFFAARENQDIIQVASELRNVRNSMASKPVKQARKR